MMLVFRVTDRVVEVDATQNYSLLDSDYTAQFSFDAEWAGKIKTARFEQGDGFTDVVLENDACTIPPLKMGRVKIGVFSDDMTTTPVELIVNESIKDISGNPKDPTLDVYGQLIKMIEAGQSGGSGEPSGNNDNIMFVNLTLLEGYTPTRYACDMKEVDVWNAVKAGKIVYAIVSDTGDIYRAEDAGDEMVYYSRCFIRGNELYWYHFEKDWDTDSQSDADGRTWKHHRYEYSLTRSATYTG